MNAMRVIRRILGPDRAAGDGTAQAMATARPLVAEQAREVGVNPQAVVTMRRRGTIERAAHGV